MGGEVRVVYRQEDGTVHTRTRHTNSMGRFLKSHRIAERDHGWMMNYFTPEFRVDYSYSKADDVLVPVAPHQYGIIVVDFQANQIMAAQNYTDIARISAAEATGAFYRPEGRADAISNFTEMPSNRLRIRRRVYTTFQQNTTHIETLGDLLTKEEHEPNASRMLTEYQKQLDPFREKVNTMEVAETYIDENFAIDFSPLEQSLLFMDSDATSLTLIKTRMDETGFAFTETEQDAWENEIKKALRRSY